MPTAFDLVINSININGNYEGLLRLIRSFYYLSLFYKKQPSFLTETCRSAYNLIHELKTFQYAVPLTTYQCSINFLLKILESIQIWVEFTLRRFFTPTAQYIGIFLIETLKLGLRIMIYPFKGHPKKMRSFITPTYTLENKICQLTHSKWKYDALSTRIPLPKRLLYDFRYFSMKFLVQRKQFLQKLLSLIRSLYLIKPLIYLHLRGVPKVLSGKKSKKNEIVSLSILFLIDLLHLFGSILHYWSLCLNKNSEVSEVCEARNSVETAKTSLLQYLLKTPISLVFTCSLLKRFTFLPGLREIFFFLIRYLSDCSTIYSYGWLPIPIFKDI
ncbi:hypothetical protein SNEBB_001254 [Seison nebaliae]|nr:hypothetical protein SNEBB_001254 [Seison nebaliae]